jgi:hypothetical protein
LTSEGASSDGGRKKKGFVILLMNKGIAMVIQFIGVHGDEKEMCALVFAIILEFIF